MRKLLVILLSVFVLVSCATTKELDATNKLEELDISAPNTFESWQEELDRLADEMGYERVKLEVNDEKFYEHFKKTHDLLYAICYSKYTTINKKSVVKHCIVVPSWFITAPKKCLKFQRSNIRHELVHSRFPQDSHGDKFVNECKRLTKKGLDVSYCLDRNGKYTTQKFPSEESNTTYSKYQLKILCEHEGLEYRIVDNVRILNKFGSMYGVKENNGKIYVLGFDRLY